MEPSACERFFKVPELVLLLITHLEPSDISRFMLINHTFHSFCIPTLYHALTLNYTPEQSNLLHSAVATFMLAKHTRHVHKLHCGVLELVYFSNALLAFDDIKSQVTGTPPPNRPNWLPARDTLLTCQLIPLPTMDRLTTFVLDADIEFSSRLLEDVDNDSDVDEDEDEDFESEGGGEGEGEGEGDGDGGESGPSEGDNDGDGENEDDDGGEDDSGDEGEVPGDSVNENEEIQYFGTGDGAEGGDLIAAFGNERLTKRMESIFTLKTLWLWDLVGYTTEGVRAIFEKYPSIEQLHLPNICGTYDVDGLARTIVALCPKLSTFQFYGEGCSPTDSAAIRTILTGCGALEDLRFVGTHEYDYEDIWPYPELYGKGCGILLKDAIAAPWACTRIKHLNLLVRINELRTEPELGRPAYFHREAPVKLSPIETRYFEPLEHFYRQIGRLTELRHLDLRMDMMGPDGERQNNIPTYMEVSFPGLLNIGMGRPGYLELLGGLSKLKELRGSVFLDTYETELRVGAVEVFWMREHWPLLESADFFAGESEVTQPFRWFCADQKKREIELNLVVHFKNTDDMIVRGWAFPPP
ncbi:hypothetical protein K457DRAFT_16922 [Linnemannia elongata AG-77]|uniref:Uncharacterized protein n=1 Tax=Linnemannia elongata AG-77 TaxID=1314771 RepID=A0A197K3I3_9FUNG|nr:hypothetical protein K457DRAFT_16922 [Linnemannia elongata AG-77]